MSAPTIRIECADEDCTNHQVLAADCDLPAHWLCSTCLDRIDEQMADELERRENSRRTPAKAVLARPLTQQETA